MNKEILEDPLDSFTDKWGFIIHKDVSKYPYDGGDSGQRTFSVYIDKYFTEGYMQFLNAKRVEKLATITELTSGEIIRHPDVKYWWGQEGTMSWDNLICRIICLSLYHKHSDELKKMRRRLFWNLVKRFGFTWNKYPIDPTPEEKLKPKIPDNAFIRVGTWTAFTRGTWFLYPLTLALDTLLIPNVLFRIVMSWVRPADTGDNLNLQRLLIHGQMQQFSPIVYILARVYSLFLANPIDPSTGQKMPGYAPYNMIRAYFHDSEEHPPVYLSQRLVIEEYV